MLKLCKKYFGKKDLYEVFDIPKDASEKEIRQAYRRLSLKVHPDRVAEDEKAEATEKFKVVSAVHSILSIKSKRELYDKTGSVENDDDLDLDNWRQYWQSIFKEVTEQDIIDYEKKYKGSQEEYNDLKRAYVGHKGDMNRILEHVLFSNPDDEPRLEKIIKKWIEDEEVPAFEKFLNEPASRKDARKRKYEKEAKLAAKESKKRKSTASNESTGEEDLFKAIQSRQSSRAAQQNNFLDKLAEKYSTKPTKGRKK